MSSADANKIEENETAIATINERLDSGVTQTSNDGINATISPAELRIRRDELKDELAKLNGESNGDSFFNPVVLP